MNRPSLLPVPVADADRALYLDFEGLMGEVPCLLGVRPGRLGPTEQFILDPRLAPMAGYTSPSVTWPVRAVDPVGLFRRLRTDVRREGLRVFAWSTRESRAMAELLADDPELAAYWTDVVENAVPHAKAWKRRHHAEVEFPKDERRGRHRLECYEELLGMHRTTVHGGGLTTKRIRGVRKGLARHGAADQLTRTQKGYWTKLLVHNELDCAGLATVVTRVAEDRP
jgi:hypothetical protein